MALAGLCFLACMYRILRGTMEENCARWRKRSKAPKVKPGATPTPARKKPWSSSKKPTKPKVKKPVPSRGRTAPAAAALVVRGGAFRIRRRRARRAARRGRRRGGRPKVDGARRRRLDDDDDDDDDRFAGRLVDHTTRRRPVDKPPSIFGSARPPASSDDASMRMMTTERARGRSAAALRRAREPRVGLRPVVRRRQREYDLPGPPPARRLEMSAAKARSPPMRPPMPPPSPAFPSAFVASRPLYRK